MPNPSSINSFKSTDPHPIPTTNHYNNKLLFTSIIITRPPPQMEPTNSSQQLAATRPAGAEDQIIILKVSFSFIHHINSLPPPLQTFNSQIKTTFIFSATATARQPAAAATSRPGQPSLPGLPTASRRGGRATGHRRGQDRSHPGGAHCQTNTVSLNFTALIENSNK
jgi:hypothetical protein